MVVTKKIITMAVLLTLLAGCGGAKKIDSSTDETFKSSIAAVKSPLNAEKKKEFEEAVQVLSLSEAGNLFVATVNPDGVQRKLRDRLHGKTADEIIVEANRIIAEREAEEKRISAEREVSERRILAEYESEKRRINAERAAREKQINIAKQKAELERKRLAAEKAKLAPKGAFGITFGDIYTPPDNENNAVKLTDGETAYLIGAPKKFRKFRDVALLVTPQTHKIYGILAAVKLDSKDKAEAEYEIISGILSQKYKIKPERMHFYYAGSGCNFLFKDSGISLCTEDNQALVKLIYTDTGLAELAKKERLEIESQKSDSSAI